MTLSVTFYDNIKYRREDFINRDKDFFGNGVVNSSDFPLTYPATPNMTVNVGQGTAWVDGYRVANDSNTVQLTIPAADATNPRIDIIQIGHDDLNSAPSLVVKKGVAAASPVEPGADQNYIKLFAINVAANATSISSANVTDRRVLVPLKVSGSQIQTSGLLSNDPGAVTDTNIGNRTADPTQTPSGLTGTITQWFSWITNRIKTIVGKTNWWDVPSMTLEDIFLRFTRTPTSTTVDITLYVSSSGNDANDGLTSATALKTIQAAINKIPQIVNHNVTINVAAGTYSEDVLVAGFSGKGYITLVGGNAAGDTHVVKSIRTDRDATQIVCRGFKATTTAATGFSSLSCVNVWYDGCKCDAMDSNHSAFDASNSNVTISGSIISNRSIGIHATGNSNVYSYNNSGTGNAIGLRSIEASTIGKQNGQPGGTTAEYTESGGVIR